ncbi:hypothetical protein [Haloplanus salilacus]
MEDITAPDDELSPEERFGAIVEELPDGIVEQIEAAETARTADVDGSPA